MGGIPSYTFVCKECGFELQLERLEMEKFQVIPCPQCLKIPIRKIVFQPVRNLIYHLMPFGNYRWNLEQLLRRWSVFTGKKVIAIATAQNFDSPNVVKTIFPKDSNLSFIEVKNNAKLADTQSLLPLLSLASEFDRAGITLYAHAKGVSRNNDPAVMLWTESLYRYNLDFIEKVDAHLRKFPVTGCCKRYGKFAHFPKGSTTHFSGTFFWVRNKDLFERNWKSVPQTRFGSEAYISLLFQDSEISCMWGDRFQNGYKFDYIKSLVEKDPYFKPVLELYKDYKPTKYIR